MSDFDPITLARLRYLVPGASAADYAAAVLDLNASLGKDVLSKRDLPKGTELRARLAIQDTSLAFTALSNIFTSIANTEEQRDNLVFLLAKAIDDSLNLGAFYMAGRPKENLPPPITIHDIASAAGVASGLSRSKAAEKGWKTTVRRIAIAIMRDGKARSANKLATDVLTKWDGPDAHRRDPKTLREYLEGMADELEPPFALKVNVRSKKVRR